MPDLLALELLLDVGRTGSLGAAGRAHGVTQQAVSARLQGVERQVGVPLLTTGPTGSRLTADGALLANWATRLLDVAQEVDHGIGSLRQDRAATLSVAASLTVAEHLLPRWLVALRASVTTAAPAVTLTATNSERVVALVRDGEVDIGFIESPNPDIGLRMRTVDHDALVVVVAPDHPWARRRRPLGAAELARTPLVAREGGSGTRQVLEKALRAALGEDAVIAEPALELTTTAAVRGAVLAGAGPSALSTLAVGDDLTLARMVQVDTTGIDLGRPLRAIWRGSATPPAGPVRNLVAIAAADTIRTTDGRRSAQTTLNGSETPTSPRRTTGRAPAIRASSRAEGVSGLRNTTGVPASPASRRARSNGI